MYIYPHDRFFFHAWSRPHKNTQLHLYLLSHMLVFVCYEKRETKTWNDFLLLSIKFPYFTELTQACSSTHMTFDYSVFSKDLKLTKYRRFSKTTFILCSKNPKVVLIPYHHIYCFWKITRNRINVVTYLLKKNWNTFLFFTLNVALKRGSPNGV